jgi:hypothetical protein
MAKNDPWTGVTWKVQASQEAGGKYLKPDNRPGQFTLTAVQDPETGSTAYYRVHFADGDMPPSWKGRLLYPLGNVPAAHSGPPLEPWTPGTDAVWTAAANTVRSAVQASTARLRGDISPTHDVQALTLVRVDGATTEGKPMLALHLHGKKQGTGVHPLDDGTAHGN